jgi:hypothetical protein
MGVAGANEILCSSSTAKSASVNFHSHGVTGCSVRVGFSTTYTMMKYSLPHTERKTENQTSQLAKTSEKKQKRQIKPPNPLHPHPS